jgi:hypothetical protein
MKTWKAAQARKAMQKMAKQQAQCLAFVLFFYSF